MLARLQEQRLVTSEWETRPEDAADRPPRKYYQLTAEAPAPPGSSSPAPPLAASRSARRPHAAAADSAMSAHRRARQIAEHLIARACRRLPQVIATTGSASGPARSP